MSDKNDSSKNFEIKKKRGRPPKPKTMEALDNSPLMFAELNDGDLVAAAGNDSLMSSDDSHYIYGQNWIVLQNRLLHAISDLTLNERRLVLFLSPLVRADVEQFPDKAERVFTVRTHDFAEQYNLKPSNLYKALEDTSVSILKKAFFFWDFREDKQQKGVKAGSSWVDYCTYHPGEGYIEIVLASRVVEMLTVFDRNNPYTKYYRDWIVKLGIYGMVLFELIVSADFGDKKTVTYTLNYLRKKFDCEDKYPTYFEFKRNVLTAAIKEIHKHTPYRIEFKQIREGRSVTQLEFTFTNTASIPKVETAQEMTDVLGIDVIRPEFKGMRVKIGSSLEQEFLDKYREEPKAIAYCIEAANKYIDGKVARNEKIENVQAVYISALRKGWGLSTLEAEKEQHLLDQKEAEKRAVKERQRQNLINRFEETCRLFNDLPQEEQIKIIDYYISKLTNFTDIAFAEHTKKFCLKTGTASLTIAVSSTERCQILFCKCFDEYQAGAINS